LNHDSFFLKPTKEFEDIYNPQWDIQFIHDSNGNITTIEMAGQIEPIEFNK
jgi:hypothetical protein